jgi:hypothetical protein
VIVFPGDTTERAWWSEALEATRDGWRRAFYCEPEPCEEVFRVLADVLVVEREFEREFNGYELVA